jgi:Ran GTPase-activating protein 1
MNRKTSIIRKINKKKDNSIFEVLNFSNNNLELKGINKLLSRITNYNAVKKLFLGNNNICNEGALVIANNVLSSLPLLKSLNLSDNKIEDEGAYNIFDALVNNTSLTRLDLSSNKINLKKYYLPDLPFLKSLYLSDNNIYNIGASNIANGLINNTSLKRLDVSDNNIRNTGASSFANLLTISQFLTSLDLSDNKIKDKGAYDIAKALLNNRSLLRLDLSGNKINLIAAEELAEAYVKCNLTFISFRYNNFDDYMKV